MDPPKSIYPPSFPYAGSGKTFITEDHPQFKACFKTSYQGFVREESSELPAALHTGFRDALDALDAGGVFQVRTHRRPAVLPAHDPSAAPGPGAGACVRRSCGGSRPFL